MKINHLMETQTSAGLEFPNGEKGITKPTLTRVRRKR